MLKYILHHAIENITNQNTGKPSYVRVCRVDSVGHFIFTKWYEIAMQCSLGVKRLVYTKKIQVARRTFHGTPLESVA